MKEIFMKRFLPKLILLSAFTLLPLQISYAATTQTSPESEYIKTYTQLVYLNYKDAAADAQKLKKTVEQLVKEPNDKNLEAAKKAWINARHSYGQTEAFRFYEGPIDDKDGPESYLNAWPVNEAYIDYVDGNPNAGIINDSSIKITKQTLNQKNQADDEANVATGYHAIEFLLWGQDLSETGPGNRPVSDYDQNTNAGKRRGDYLITATEMLVQDLESLVKEWQPGNENYAKAMLKSNPEKHLGHILTSLATLSGFELASERIATSLDSGDQEDEHSCFSDNTHNDFIDNALGIKNVYLGRYDDFNGYSLHKLISQKDKNLADKILSQIQTTETLIASIAHPFDQKVLATDPNSMAHDHAEEMVISLQKQSDLFKEAGKLLGVEVTISE